MRSCPGTPLVALHERWRYLGLYWQKGRKLRVFLGDPEENVPENNKTGSLPADLPGDTGENEKKTIIRREA